MAKYIHFTENNLDKYDNERFANYITTLSAKIEAVGAKELGVEAYLLRSSLLAVMAQDFPGHSGMPLIAMLTQLGYAMGLLLLVPLGDVVERRWLIPGQFALIALASLLAATATSATTTRGMPGGAKGG